MVEQTASVETPPRKPNRWKQAALFLAVAFTAYGSVVSTISVQKSNDALNLVQRISFCNTTILGQALDSLNGRSAYSTKAADANLALQKDQAALLLPSIKGQQPTPEEGTAALKRYFDSLTSFVVAAEAAKGVANNSPYPDRKDISKCIAQSGDNPTPTPSQ